MAKITLKPIMLGYHNIGAANDNASYTDLEGVLRGLTITQDDPESNSIDAEFFDSPFYIENTMNPVTINFDWVNFDLTELVNLLGGEMSGSDYNAPTSATSPEKCWKLDFGVGYKSLIIYRGQLTATLKKDEDGALAYACTITSLVETIGSGTNKTYRLYTIKDSDSLSVASTTPTLPSESTATSITVTFNKNIAFADIEDAVLAVKDTSEGETTNYTFDSNGKVNNNSTEVGTYTISNKVLSITLTTGKYIDSFTLTSGN